MKMKNLMLTVAASMMVGTFAFAKDGYKKGTYQIDSAHSRVGFEIPHLVISSVEGRFNDFKGTLKLDPNLAKSKAEATIVVSSIDTGVDKRDEHLRSADFFEASKFGEMKFVSTAFVGKPDDFSIKGNLTIKGVTKPVTLKAKYLGSVTDGYGNFKVAFTAETEISRKEFGITWNSMIDAGPMIGDKVKINLSLQAALDQPKK